MPKLIFEVCSLTAHRNKRARPAEIFTDFCVNCLLSLSSRTDVLLEKLREKITLF